jgi:hypothetical protein
MSQVRILSFRPKKEKIALAVVFSFFAWYVNSVLFCRAKAGSHTVGITKRSEVTLSFRQNKDYSFDTISTEVIVLVFCSKALIYKAFVHEE